MTVKDATGNTLVSEGVPLAWRTTADNRPIGSFSIPGTDYVGWVIGTLGTGDTTIKPGQMQVELYDAATGTPGRRQGHRPGHADDDRGPDRHLRPREPVHRPQRRP